LIAVLRINGACVLFAPERLAHGNTGEKETSTA
jgi:hypothetical protein